MSKVQILNISIDNLTMEEALDRIGDFIQSGKPSYVVTPNLDHVVQLERDAYFREAYAHADLVLADGKPLLWIAKHRRTPIRAKISGSDLFPQLAARVAEKGYSMYFLGAAPGVAQRAADKLKEQYPSLEIRGCDSPPLGFEHDREEVRRIIHRVRKAHPDILIVALGTPKQEKFMYRYRELLGVPVSLGLGGTFDFVSGERKRAPRWMSEHGLEWLYRTIQEPRRLAGRYLKDAILIIPLLIKYRKRRHYEDLD